MIQFAAVLACVVLFGLMVFQVALILGAPIGKYAWGGAHKVLPRSLRIGSLISIFLYILFGYIILAKVGIVQSLVDDNLLTTAIWILSGYFVVGVILNAISRSKSERLVMTPAAFVLAVLFLFVSFK